MNEYRYTASEGRYLRGGKKVDARDIICDRLWRGS